MSKKQKKKKSAQFEINQLCKGEEIIDSFIDDCDRVRSFSLQLYADPSHWGRLLTCAEHYAYIYHDKDKNADGTLKTPHYHLLLRFKNAKTKSAVFKLTDIGKLSTDTTVNYQRLINSSSAYQYLMHNTKDAIKEGKTRYDEKFIVSDDITYWNDVTSFNTSPNEEFLSDLFNDELTHKHLAIKYGRDYMRNFSKYESFKDIVKAEEARISLCKSRDELFSSLSTISNASNEDVEETKQLKETREILTNYISDCIIDMYYIEIENSFNRTTPSEVASSFLKSLNDEVLTKVRNKL